VTAGEPSDASETNTDAQLSRRAVDDWRMLTRALRDGTNRAAQARIGLPEPIQDWVVWIALVGRFSFPAGSIVARLERSSRAAGQ
jgi:hypothetical protein